MIHRPTKWRFAAGALALVLFTGTFLGLAARAQTTPPDPDPDPDPDTAPPVIELVEPAPGSTLQDLITIEIGFSKRVQGVDASDLLLNGVPATSVSEVVAGQFVFTFPPPEDGVLTVTWASTHGIADLATPPNPFVPTSWTYFLDRRSAWKSVMISEFMADNHRTLNDEDGNSSDWIELYNSGSVDVSLDGWFLTDTATNLSKWRIPDVNLAPGAYLVVFASEKNRTNINSKLHTNFKLAIDGEYLALVSPVTNVVSEFSPVYPKQFTDVSYGRVPGSPGTLGYFVQPTPGKINSTSGPGFSPEVRFSRRTTTFTEPFSLELSTVVPAALIRYTVDGTSPTNTSPIYAGPISVTNSTQVRARAFAPGLLPGPFAGETFILIHPSMLGVRSSLPIIVINTASKTAPSSAKYNFAHLSFYETEDGWSSISNKPVLVTRSGIRLRGSSTEGLAKSSFAVELRDELELDRKESVLGLPSESDWVLYAPNVYDPIMIHNPFIHQLSRDTGMYSSRTRFVEVYLNKTGGMVTTNSYNGIYVLEEKIKVSPNRVAIDSLEPENVKSPEVSGGYLLKIDRLDPGDSGLTAAGATMGYLDPKEKDIKLAQRKPQQDYIRNYFTAFGLALNGTNYADPNSGYAAYINVQSWVDFHILEVLSGNVDSLVLSTYFHKPRNGKITFGPHWDFDRALGSTDGRDANPRLWQTGPFFSSPWWSRVCRDLEFWQRWVDRYQTLRQTNLSTPNLHALIDSLSGQLREAQPRETRKWKTPFRGGTYQTEINWMKNWVSNRVDFMDKQMTPMPVLSLPPGKVASGAVLNIKVAAGATAYYTVNGTDPRLRGGEISPKAILYTGPVSLEDNARVVVRARNTAIKQSGGPPATTPWSAPAVATYVVATPPIGLGEIMYHPSAPSLGSTNTASDYEFLELVNRGTLKVSLAGFHLTNGVTYTFTATSGVTDLAAGGRVLIVRNRAAFLQRYPQLSASIAGEYVGSLGNGGNQLTLLGPLEEPIFDFRYEGDWFPMADGFGFSLVPVPESADTITYGNASAWRLSTLAGGSPGVPDQAPSQVLPVYVNEAFTRSAAAHYDTVELFNPNTVDVSVAGWYLTDDYRTPAKYRFPAATTIPAGGFLLVDERQFGAGPAGFGLSSSGDEIHLFSADAAGALTGYSHGFAFGSSPDQASFGRYVSTDGMEHFVLQRSMTLGGTNSGPLIGSVVLSEFRPETDALAYVEILNRTAATVALFDPVDATQTWHLRGTVDFDFPQGVSLAAGARAVVVGFDPTWEPDLDREFRRIYHVPVSTPLYGPFQGHLGPVNGTLRLTRPEIIPGSTAGAPVTVEHIDVDEVEFGTAAWQYLPEGFTAYERVDATVFGNDATNWRPVTPTVGDADSDGDGLPDGWEAAHGLDPHDPNAGQGALGDLDGDGVTNRDEFLAGTDPGSADDHLMLQAQRADDGAVVLSFQGQSNHDYIVYQSDQIIRPVWRMIQLAQAGPTGRTIQLRLSPTSSGGYFKVGLR